METLHFDSEEIRRRTTVLETVDSTNLEARRRGVKGAPEGAVFVAVEQAAGRGRLGRVWTSPPGGLWMSMLVRPSGGSDARMPRLSLAAGVAAATGLAQVFEETGLDPDIVKLGWPNDLLVEDRKIGGILCELCTDAPSAFVIVGLGINLNNSAQEMPQEIADISTSVFDLSGQRYPVGLALEKTAPLLDNYISAALGGGFEKVLDEWRMRAALFGRKVKLQSPGSEPAVVMPYDIDDAGGLLVRDSAGGRRAVEFEETTLVR